MSAFIIVDTDRIEYGKVWWYVWYGTRDDGMVWWWYGMVPYHTTIVGEQDCSPPNPNLNDRSSHTA